MRGLPPLTVPGFPDCVGCGAQHPHGLRLTFFRDGDAVVGSPVIPSTFQGGLDVAHGGIVTLVLDEYCCAIGYADSGGPVVTGELTVRFEAPCPVDTPLHARAWVSDRSHPRYRIIEAELHQGDRLLARSRGRFFPMPDQGGVTE